MRLQKTPIALAAIALFSVAPLAAEAAPTVSFRAPAAGATISQDITQTAQCEATGQRISSVTFSLRRSGASAWTTLNTEGGSPYRCNLNPRNFPNGQYTLRAVARDSAGATATATRNITLAGSSTPTANTPPNVSLTVNSTLSGTQAPYQASASDNGSVASVEFSLSNGSTQTLLLRDTQAPYQGTFDTTRHANGTYTLLAVATDNQGARASHQRNVTISNAPTQPPPTSLPSTGTRAVATFESLGLYWTPGTNPGNAGCHVRYRRANESQWREGLALWYDARNRECRGSLVHLTPGTDYVVQLGLPGQAPSRQLTARTWRENFPIARTVHVASRSQQLNITEGGTASGYVLYTPAPGTQAVIDVNNNADYNIAISAPYVIVRGLTLRDARQDGIRFLPGAHDVVIEDNDISGWGRSGRDRDSAVRADCRDGTGLERTVIQRNRLHHPRYGANSWDSGHPIGAQAITYSFCGGNHVMRYNEIYSSEGRYFNDGISGEANFSATGFPRADTDIYGNSIRNAHDDGIEAEGGNRNVRIWGNYIDQTAIGIATSVTHEGPLYMFRNVYNRSRMYFERPLDQDGRQNFAKSGANGEFGNGRRYVFHNTLLQATQSGLQFPLGAGGGIVAAGTTQPLTNTVSRNNVLHVWKATSYAIRTQGGGSNDFDYDLRNGGIDAYAGAEPNGIVATPIY
ncbi:MAG TPA: Ig-like domain-containing protein, partial [Burkholderiales bacterium]|nr:Ig-like domain-containing protein [Burkholderiales bacterium]